MLNLKQNIEVPFGGLQVVMSGDMLQLQPVNGDFAFKSLVWRQLNLKQVRLIHPYRYPDLKFYELLLRAREGSLNTEDVKF